MVWFDGAGSGAPLPPSHGEPEGWAKKRGVYSGRIDGARPFEDVLTDYLRGSG